MRSWDLFYTILHKLYGKIFVGCDMVKWDFHTMERSNNMPTKWKTADGNKKNRRWYLFFKLRNVFAQLAQTLFSNVRVTILHTLKC